MFKIITSLVCILMLAGCALMTPRSTSPMQQTITLQDTTPKAVLEDIAERAATRMPNATIKSMTSNRLVVAERDKSSHIVFNPRSGNLEETTGVKEIIFTSFAYGKDVVLTLTGDYELPPI